MSPYDEVQGVTSPVSKGQFRPTPHSDGRIVYSIKVAGNNEREFRIPIHSFRPFPRGLDNEIELLYSGDPLRLLQRSKTSDFGVTRCVLTDFHHPREW